jgi:hypothetical protein
LDVLVFFVFFYNFFFFEFFSNRFPVSMSFEEFLSSFQTLKPSVSAVAVAAPAGGAASGMLKGAMSMFSGKGARISGPAGAGPGVGTSSKETAKQAVLRILSAHVSGDEDLSNTTASIDEVGSAFELGDSKIFLRSACFEQLERTLNTVLAAKVAKFQAILRAKLMRRRYLATIKGFIRLQALMRMRKKRLIYQKDMAAEVAAKVQVAKSAEMLMKVSHFNKLSIAFKIYCVFRLSY